MMKEASTFGIAMVLLVMMSCSDSQKLTAEDKLAIDTTTYNINKKIDIENSKWCAEHSDSLVQKAVDSLIVLRRKQIAKQLEDVKSPQ